MLREIDLLHALTQAKAVDGKRPAKLEDVTSLYLSDTAVTDAGMRELAPLKNLTYLELNFTKVTDRTLGVLREINLLHALSVATAADRKRPTKPEDVTTLTLRETRVTDAGLKELAPLKNLTTLNLYGTQVTDRTLAVLREINLLHALRQATAADGKRPAKPDDVAALDLGDTAVTDAGLKELAALKNLTTLGLFNTKVTDAGLKELAKLTTLTTLDLTTLDLSDSKVTDAGVKELQKSLPNCKITK